MLRLQELELQMKVLLAAQEQAGNLETMEANRTARKELFAAKTLGSLVKTLFESYVIAEDSENHEPSAGGGKKIELPTISIRSGLSMSDEDRAEAKAKIEDLVAMRNDLVHHLLDRFDLRSDDGCQAAISHLAHCLDRAERHLAQVQEWMEGMKEARAYAAAFLESHAIQDLIKASLLSTHPVERMHPVLAVLLQEGLRRFSSNGWARVSDVTRWIQQNHPDQTPQAHGCKTWRQLLHQSGSFELQLRTDQIGKKVPWFRERPSDQAKH